MMGMAGRTTQPNPRHWWWRTAIAGLVLCMAAASALFLLRPAVFAALRSAPQFERVVIEGRGASGTTIDCGGGWFNEGKCTELLIRSSKSAAGWDRPERITIRNCRIHGSIRIMGMGRNGEAPEVRKSSIRPGHTGRAQAAAPTGIVIQNVIIEADGRIPLYLAPGVTGVTFENSHITGLSVSTGVYLDAESAGNVIRNNTFALRSLREVIAVDGSAHNRIERNRFELPSFGGIYLYRNCGEGGTVRHQTPHDNVISNNRFGPASPRLFSRGIWLGSRNGRRSYCDLDAGYSFGSSADNRDFADHNVVTGNLFTPPTRRAVRNDGHDNRVDPMP
jgi:hypothetical protein